jgi:hypothetical protein
MLRQQRRRVVLVKPEARARPPLPVRHPGRCQGRHHRLDQALQQCPPPLDPRLRAADRVGAQLRSHPPTSCITKCPAGGGKVNPAAEILAARTYESGPLKTIRDNGSDRPNRSHNPKVPRSQESKTYDLSYAIPTAFRQLPNRFVMVNTVGNRRPLRHSSYTCIVSASRGTSAAPAAFRSAANNSESLYRRFPLTMGIPARSKTTLHDPKCSVNAPDVGAFS